MHIFLKATASSPGFCLRLYCTVNVMVAALLRLPAVALTVTVLVPAGVVVLVPVPPPLPEELPPPPQATSAVATPATSKTGSSVWQREPLHFLRWRTSPLSPKRTKARNVSPSPTGRTSGWLGSRIEAVATFVARVRVVVAAALPPGVTVAGENEQVL